MHRRHVHHRPLGNQWLHCSFCHRASVGDFYHLRNDRSDSVLPAKLCLEHLWTLHQAGAKGRVHAATGIRWWLAEPGPQRRAQALPDGDA